MNDLDLMVRPEDLLRAIDVLGGVGYQQQNFIFHVVLTRGPKYRTTVELHWRVYPANEITPSADEWFWSEAQSYENPTYPGCYAFSPLAEMLFLSTHLIYGHGSSPPRLIWCYEIFLLASNHGESLNWAGLIERVRAFGWSIALYHALRIVGDRFDIPIPEGYLSELESDCEEVGIPISENLPAGLDISVPEKTWHALEVLDGQTHIRAIKGLLFPSADFMRLFWQHQKPVWFWRLYYPILWVFRFLIIFVIKKS